MKINRIENLTTAVERLNEAKVAFSGDRENTLYRDALIQRFEFSLELAWKTLKEVLADLLFSEKELSSPRSVIAKAYQENLIDNEDIWIDMLTERNNMAHRYSEDEAAIVADKIVMKFCKVLQKLVKELK